MATVIRSPAGRFRGAAFRELLRYLAAQRGHAALVRVVERLPSHLHDQLDIDDEALGVLVTRWYDAELVHPLLDAVVAEFPADAQETVAAEAAAFVMQATLRGVYRILFDWLATPGRYARYGGRLWGMYYDSGRLEIEQVDEHRARSRTVDWASHHPFACQLNRFGATEIYKAMGRNEVRTERIACVDEGADACQFVTTWRA